MGSPALRMTRRRRSLQLDRNVPGQTPAVLATAGSDPCRIPAQWQLKPKVEGARRRAPWPVSRLDLLPSLHRSSRSLSPPTSSPRHLCSTPPKLAAGEGLNLHLEAEAARQHPPLP